ncbi:hypothetical protein [Lysinibacillus antri]|uniref:Uncharacterized protein n=1 Tax=Lysinibacillus antri TaxID=2498145 RepID=A0A432LAM8_9BACI|nr:hypothetical protein [Lysinibacillus antri]RUL51109.1 hypothetical protein EK386_12940 [Lysinibacillus antri]
MTTKTTKIKMPSVEQLQRDIYAFWKEYAGKKGKSYTTIEKTTIAKEFLTEQHHLWKHHLNYLHDKTRDDGKIKGKKLTLMDIELKHPAYYRKGSVRKACIYDIIADFIATEHDAIIEDVRKYPVYSEAQELSRQQMRLRHEIAIFDIDSDDEDARQPFGTISSDDLAQQVAERPETYEVTKEMMYELIDDWKANIDEIVADLLKMRECTLDKRSLRRKISRLSYDSVKECKECGQVFYAKDARTEVCDLTVKYIVKDNILIPTKKSVCWQRRNAYKTRKSKGKCAI